MSNAPRSNSDNHANLVPPVVKGLLAPDEQVEARYELKRAEAYATSSRLIILRAGQTVSHAYSQIAGVREFSRTHAWLILGGAALFILGGTSPAFPVAGAALILIGVLSRSRRVEILVTGLREPVLLDGAGEVLGPLAKKLSEKRGRVST